MSVAKKKTTDVDKCPCIYYELGEDERAQTCECGHSVEKHVPECEGEEE